MTKQMQISLIETELKVRIPNSYGDFLWHRGSGVAFGLPILGLPATYEFSTVLGATSLLRIARPECQNYLAIRIYDDRMLCLDLTRGNNIDAPLVEIYLNSTDSPRDLGKLFSEYIKDDDRTKLEINSGLQRLENLIDTNNENGLQYNHTDNSVPFKARHWRVHRCCVHDLVVGLTAFRYNENFNGIEVDTFLSTEHPNYETGHGTKALLALILADAYMKGTSMEVRFVANRIPATVLSVLNNFEIKLQQENEGVINHSESISIFSSLLGIQNDVKAIIQELEKAKELTLQGICFLINRRVWAIEEINWLIINAPRTKAVIFGRDNPEVRLLYSESLSFGRCALAFSKLKEKIQISSEDEKIETQISIRNDLFVVSISKNCFIDWLSEDESLPLKLGETLTVRSRPRSALINIVEQIQLDIKAFEGLEGKKVILYTNDILKLPDFNSIYLSLISQHKLNYLIIPVSSEELNDEVISKFKKARRYRT